VSSTSNASLASAIKKRKAPVPPPALQEQVETSEKIPPAAAPVVVVVVNGGSHDDSDRASCVSDQLSSVSDMSSTRRKSSATPEIIEPPIVVELTPQPNHQQSSGEQAEIQNWNHFFNEIGQMLDLDSRQQQKRRVSNF
jgi:hypothetical protein